jgi:hypothetical protein
MYSSLIVITKKDHWAISTVHTYEMDGQTGRAILVGFSEIRPKNTINDGFAEDIIVLCKSKEGRAVFVVPIFWVFKPVRNLRSTC